jgi:hypothetical protein
VDVGLHDRTTVSLCFRSLYSLLLLLSIFLHGIRASLRSLPSSLMLCFLLFLGCFSKLVAYVSRLFDCVNFWCFLKYVSSFVEWVFQDFDFLLGIGFL